MIIINKVWNDFKSETSLRNLLPQFYEEDHSYQIYGQDGMFLFYCNMGKESSEAEDFETNYKNKWNKRLDYRDSRGIMQNVASPRPEGTANYFCGAGDHSTNGIAAGTEIFFDMLSTDTSLAKDLTFNENIYIKSGFIYSDTAPFGAYFESSIVHPVAGVVANFAKKTFIIGKEKHEFITTDAGLINKDLILRIKLYNADGLNGHDSPIAFKVIGNIHLYRSTTT